MDINDLVIKAVIFDFDGTLTQPGALDFAVIKAAVGCPSDTPVLEHINALTDIKQKQKANDKLEDFETSGAANSQPAVGAEALIGFLRDKKIPIGIVTRNSRRSVDRALNNFSQVSAADFDLIISRDDNLAPKPDPAGIVYASAYFNLAPANLLMVGDYLFDIEAGNRAQTTTALIAENIEAPGFVSHPDIALTDLNQLKTFIEMHLPLPAGKFPNDLLGKYLDALTHNDPQLLISPGVGEDTAAIAIENEEVLILKSDPITFATDAIGQYAVLVNANDIATAGAEPRWLLSTLIFPCQTTPAKILGILRDLKTHCQKWDITLCGGHTEISDAVNRPVISGMMVGTVSRSKLVDKNNIRQGDAILVTKKAAVEGTSLIAREFPQRLLDAGMTQDEIEHCRTFIDRISILAEARIARDNPGVSAMHDVTEGGLATAIWELGAAAKHTFKIDLDRIPIYAETQKISDMLGIDPLGLIASGSLLICCHQANCEELIKTVQQANIEITMIGEVLAPGTGVKATRGDLPTTWPQFATDEITQLF